MSVLLIEQSTPSDESATDVAALIAKTVDSGGEVVESGVTAACSHAFVVADQGHPTVLEADLRAVSFDAKSLKIDRHLIERGPNEGR